jgi:hypothetical protein
MGKENGEPGEIEIVEAYRSKDPVPKQTYGNGRFGNCGISYL